MSTTIKSAIVRIWSTDNQIVGAGFLVSERFILTCAHVVSDALEKPRDIMPDIPIRLDFPFIAPKQMITVVITTSWLPKQKDGTGDIAVLELQSSPPNGTRPIQMVVASNLWGHHFRAFGFPAQRNEGVWVSGVMRDSTTNDYIHIEDTKASGYPIQPGFSGTPVWDETLNGVIGMVALAEPKKTIKAAFIIPTTVLVEVWPELSAWAVSPPTIRFFPNGYDLLPQYYTPRPKLLNKLKSALLSDGSFQAYTQAFKLDALHGMGGIGKSVTARALCDARDIQDSFSDGILWATLGQTVTEDDLQTKLRDWIYALDNTVVDLPIGLDGLKMTLTNLLREKTCLLVLDDVWRQSDASWFLVEGTQSQYLLTSRDTAVVEALGATIHTTECVKDFETPKLIN